MTQRERAGDSKWRNRKRARNDKKRKTVQGQEREELIMTSEGGYRVTKKKESSGDNK